ncbi:phage portal protein family protein [Ornithobacterium rhinotracheale]|uniref:phage portal protein family protein n=1 Tax=Ornithobacterium rhinotracheale TaxID=28251 RepID=UPI003FA4C39B
MSKIGFKQKNSQKKTLNISQVLVVKPERHSSLDIENWITAISQAYRGRRQKLVELYNNLLMDGVLYEAMDKRVRAITNANLTFQKDGKEVEEMWDFMDTPEFEKLLREILLSKFYGKSIVELDFSDGFKVQSIDRRHIDTLHKFILKDTSSDEGIPYEDNDFILNIGDDKDLGIFARTAPYAIFKRNGGADYAQFCELFGIPQLIGKYDPDDENGQKEMEESFRKRGAAADMVLSNKSSVETLQTNQSNGAVHREFLEHWDKQILISAQGQTMTTTDGTSLAQAKVHSNTENDLNKADKIFVRRFLNQELKPRLEKRGYPVAGGFFNFIDEKEDLKAIDKLSVAERVNQLTADGVDDDYFYEEFGLPRGAKSKEREQEKERAETQEEEEIQTDEPPKEKPKNKQKNTPKVKKVQAKDLSLFDKLKDFFAHAPR